MKTHPNRKRRQMKTCGTCQFAKRCNVAAWTNSTYVCSHESNKHHNDAWDRVKEWFDKCEHWQQKTK